MASTPDIDATTLKKSANGEIAIIVTGSQPNPQDFSTEVTLTVFDTNEPNCTNNPVPCLWDGTRQAYIGRGTFDGQLIISSRGYDADVEFISNGNSIGTDIGIPVEVVA